MKRAQSVTGIRALGVSHAYAAVLHRLDRSARNEGQESVLQYYEQFCEIYLKNIELCDWLWERDCRAAVGGAEQAPASHWWFMHIMCFHRGDSLSDCRVTTTGRK